MNRITAKVKSIDNVENLHIIELFSSDELFTMLSLELPKEIQVNSTVSINVKPTNISIAKNISGLLSLSNKIEIIIENIEIGKIVSTISLKKDNLLLESIITSKSLKDMNLEIGDKVTALIKSTDLSISGVIND